MTTDNSGRRSPLGREADETQNITTATSDKVEVKETKQEINGDISVSNNNDEESKEKDLTDEEIDEGL